MKQEMVTYLLPYLYRYLVLLMVAVGEADGLYHKCNPINHKVSSIAENDTD